MQQCTRSIYLTVLVSQCVCKVCRRIEMLCNYAPTYTIGRPLQATSLGVTSSSQKMDPSNSGSGNQGSNANQLGLYQNLDVQHWARQREELRQMRAVIEDAERRIDFGMYTHLQQLRQQEIMQQQQLLRQLQLQQQQQTATPQFNGMIRPPAPHIQFSGIPPASAFPYVNLGSSSVADAPRIIEVESDETTPATFPNSNLAIRNDTAPGISSQEYSQPSQPHTLYRKDLQPMYSNVQYSQAGPSNNSQASKNSLLANPLLLSSAQVDHYSPMTNQEEGHTRITNPMRNNARTSSAYPQASNAPRQHNWERNELVSIHPQATRINKQIVIPSKSSDVQPLTQIRPILDSSNAQPYVFAPKELSGQFQNGSGNVQTTNAEASRSFNARATNAVHYTIPPGPGQMPIRKGTHQEPVSSTVASEMATEHATDIALTPGFGPAQVMHLPGIDQDYPLPSPDHGSTVKEGQTSSAGSKHSDGVRVMAPPTSPHKREAHTLVPVASSASAPENSSKSEPLLETSSDSEFSALSNLNELLAGQNQWSGDASSRILKSVLGTANEHSVMDKNSSDEAVQFVQPHRASNIALTSSLPASIPRQHPESQGLKEELGPPSSPMAQISQILDLHESTSASGTSAPTLPNGEAPEDHGTTQNLSQPQTPYANPYRAGDASTPQARLFEVPLPPVSTTDTTTPRTPQRAGKAPSTVTPPSANANRSTLAHDVMRALRQPSTKRKRDDPNENDPATAVGFPLVKRGRTTSVGGESSGQAVGDAEFVLKNAPQHAQPPPPGSQLASVPFRDAQGRPCQWKWMSYGGVFRWCLLPISTVEERKPQSYQHLSPAVSAMRSQPNQGSASHPQSEAGMSMTKQPIPVNKEPALRQDTHIPTASHSSKAPESIDIVSSSGAGSSSKVQSSRAGRPKQTVKGGPRPIPVPENASDIIITPTQSSKGLESRIPTGIVSSFEAKIPTTSRPQSSQVKPSKQTANGGPRPIPAQKVAHGVPLTPKVVAPKLPLFLPSSESPPPLNHVSSPSPQQTYSRLSKVPIVELGPSLAKFKSRVHSAKERNLSETNAHPASSFRDLDSPRNAEPLFGRPSGALAAASVKKPLTTSKWKTSGSTVYVLIPKVDTSDWPSHSNSKSKAPGSTKPSHLSERKQHDDQDAASGYVTDFARRLTRRPCLWKNCHAVLDSAEKLLKHVKSVHGAEMDDQVCFSLYTIR
ncbi:hypothetical protein K439DRAFT_20431 [Ramaria rubella]|nr:hypothetical protein K439DRAFT_20431 [Ramaria rubella]